MAKTVTTTTDTKTLIVEQFGRAGPWALLAVLIIAGVVYEADYFLRRYVAQSDETMQAIRKNTEKLSDAVHATLKASVTLQTSVTAAHDSIKSSGKLLAEAQSQHALLIQLLDDAKSSMKPVGEERKLQTDLLRAIKEAVERNRQP